MKTLKKYWKRLQKWLKEDDMKIRRWVRAFLAWLAGIGTQLMASGLDAAMTWTLKEWGKRLLIAALFGTVGAINLGQKNPPTEEPAQQPPAPPAGT